MKGRAIIEAELAERRARFFSGSQPELLKALRTRLPLMADAIIVGHIPEQFEDIFEVLVDREHVAIVEIAREPERHVTSFEVCSADEYGKGLAGRRKRQFLVAREMVGS